MTELHFRNTEECINRIKSIKEMYTKDTPSEVALKDAINALEKQIPKEPNFGHNLSDNVSLFICKCGNKIKVHHDSGIFDNNDAPNYCKNCGQKLDWSDSD